MKRIGPKAAPEPEQVGREVREIVDAFLHGRPALATDFSARMEKFATEVARWGSKTNLTAHPDDPDEIAFHIIDSLAPIVQLAPELPTDAFGEGKQILDLGSGAGFPGLALAAACEATFDLVEARRKRASFLKVVAAVMQCRNVTVESRRAEIVVAESRYDIVTARAFGDVRDFYTLAARGLKPSGVALLYANPGQPLDDASAREAGLTNPRRLAYSVKRHTEPIQRVLATWTRT